MRITTEDIRVGFHTRQILKGISIDSGNKELLESLDQTEAENPLF